MGKVVSTIALSLVFVTATFGQEGNANVGDKQIIKDMINDTYAKVRDFIAKGNVTEASSYIDEKMEKCEGLESKDFCVAGLDFTHAYLFQQAAMKDKGRREAYEERAVYYYKKVLETYPENEVAWSNLVKLTERNQVSDATIDRFERLAEKYPSERVNYLVQLGDLLKKNARDYPRACHYYGKAYKEDPFSEKACAGLVNLFAQNDHFCSSEISNIRDFAYHCQEVELPNYAEKLLRNEAEYHFENGNYAEVQKSIVLWADILTRNNWMDLRRINRLEGRLFEERTVNERATAGIKNALDDLADLFAKEDYSLIHSEDFWNHYSAPSAYVRTISKDIYPLSVVAKIYHTKGKNAYYTGDLANAEAFWQGALQITRGPDKAYFTAVASDLAKMYSQHPEFDPGDKKLDDLVIELFQMKGDAYQEEDLQMIRRYHITLGNIFYDKGIWKGGYASNARFQLQRALSSRLGPIVNPELRKMLGDVYSKTRENDKALNAYAMAIQDHLSLDRLKSAEKLYSTITDRYRNKMDTKQSNTFTAVKNILDWRKEAVNPANALITSDDTILEFTAQAKIIEERAYRSLDENFVREQTFKGFTDIGKLLPEDRTYEKQVLYSNALNKINGLETLSSPNDFKRVQNIKVTLEERIEQPKRMETTRLQKNMVVNTNSWGQPQTHKSYVIPSLNQEILVPNQLFQLNGVLEEYQRSNTAPNTAKYTYERGKFVVKNKG